MNEKKIRSKRSKPQRVCQIGIAVWDVIDRQMDLERIFLTDQKGKMADNKLATHVIGMKFIREKTATFSLR